MTASVVLPATESVGMSRRLFVRFTDADSEPMPTASARPTHDTFPAWVYSVPSTATSPKKMNTATSPSPR